MTSDISDFSNGILDNYEASRVMVGHRRPTITKGDEGMFRQISEIALDGVSAELQAKIGWHTEATGSDALNPSSVAPQLGGEGNPLRMGMGKTAEPKPRQVQEDNTRPEGNRSIAEPFSGCVASLPVGREIATVYRRNRSEPQAPAVVFDLAMYRAQRRASLGLGEHQTILQRKIAAQARMTNAPAPPNRT